MKRLHAAAWLFAHERPLVTVAQLSQGYQLPVQADLFCVAPTFGVDTRPNKGAEDYPFLEAFPSYAGMYTNTPPFLQPLSYTPDYRSALLYCAPHILDRTSLSFSYNHRQPFNTPHERQIFDYVVDMQQLSKRSLEWAIILEDL
jgi:hypothetical protein